MLCTFSFFNEKFEIRETRLVLELHLENLVTLPIWLLTPKISRHGLNFLSSVFWIRNYLLIVLLKNSRLSTQEKFLLNQFEFPMSQTYYLDTFSIQKSINASYWMKMIVLIEHETGSRVHGYPATEKKKRLTNSTHHLRDWECTCL